MTRRPPHRHVPTLTEVVRPAAPGASDPGTPMAAPAVSQEEMVRRVMQRVDAMLERRLREAIAGVVAQHTRALAPLLREEIEASVRETVAEAFEQELGGAPAG